MGKNTHFEPGSSHGKGDEILKQGLGGIEPFNSFQIAPFNHKICSPV